MKLTILIPAFNEEEKIGAVLQKIPHTLENIEKIQILVINDGSTDKTAEIAKASGARLINNKKNLGLGRSFQIGVNEAIRLKSDLMLTIDADDQFDSKDIPKLIKPILRKEADLVTGSRFKNKNFAPINMPLVKKWGNYWMALLISSITKKRFYDVSCGFRAYSKEALLKMNLFGEFTYTQETFLDLAYKGLEIKEIPTIVTYYKERESKMAGSLFKYAYKSLKIIFRTIKDYKPLKFFGWTGILTFLVGLVFDLLVINHFLATGTFFPYKILGFLGAFLNATGIIIFFIGILADLIDKVRLTQEKILYQEKLKHYD